MGTWRLMDDDTPNTPQDFALATESGLAESRSLVHLLRLWRSKCRQDLIPARADFSHTELRPWFGYLILLDVIDGGADFHYRLFGSSIASYLGIEMTGKRLTRHPNRAAVDFYLESHRMAVRTRVPVMGEGWPEMGKVKLRRRLIMPLAADGTTVDIVMTASVPIERTR